MFLRMLLWLEVSTNQLGKRDIILPAQMMGVSLLLRIESVEVRGDFEADHHWCICEVQGLVHVVICFCDLWRIGN